MKQNNQHINRWRIREGLLGSTNKNGNNGAFSIPGPNNQTFIVVASDGMGWEHVSVHVAGVNRCPTWEEMCFIKDLFWEPHECVIQYHPPQNIYIDAHPYTLHLWKPQGIDLPMPFLEMI